MKRLWNVISIVLDVVLYVGASVRILTGNGEWIDYISISGIPLILIYQIRRCKKHKTEMVLKAGDKTGDGSKPLKK